jgi:hypothetical protein
LEAANRRKISVAFSDTFLWLAMRNINIADVETMLQRVDVGWLLAGISIYLASIGLGCLRWGFLLCVTGPCKVAPRG